MITLGINAAFHDSSACLVRNGQVIAAAEDERFTGIKHGKRPIPFSAYELPFHAIAYCLKEAGVGLADVDDVAYGYNPAILLAGHNGDAELTLPLEPSAQPLRNGWESPWDPLFLSYVVNAPRHLASGFPHHLRQWFQGIRADGPYRFHFLDHHLSHAASAALAGPFGRSAVMTIDGRGEKETTTYYRATGSLLEKIGGVQMPNSLGLLYERITTHLGFLHSSDEYKVMALASYGKPAFLAFFRELVRIGSDGTYQVRPTDFKEALGPARRVGDPIEQRHFDIAHSLQKILEETVLQLAVWLKKTTGEDNLCLAGGVALNCVMNARLRAESGFKDVWIQPAAGDAGTALGAALFQDAQSRSVSDRPYVMKNAFLGPSFSESEIETVLAWSKQAYRRATSIAEETAQLLANGKIVGWFQGRMEFGPRALGARSILASPIDPTMVERLNDIKGREEFRPVAPVVPEEDAATWFVDGRPSPFMLFVSRAQPDKAEKIPAACHVDGTARVQTVSRENHPAFHDLLRAFERRTGVPVIINTSFNTGSRPIVGTPADAVACFATSPIDALVIGPFILEKKPAVP